MPESKPQSREALVDIRKEIIGKLEEVGADEHGDLIGDLGLQEGFGDAGAAAAARADLIARVQRLLGRLNRVDEAMAQIDAGEYGVCASCGETISSERLEFRPTSVLCVSCKSAG
jgi:DnaK suppressor protein